MIRSKLLAWFSFFLAVSLLTLPFSFLHPVAVTQSISDSQWMIVTNLNHNAYHLWKSDPFSRAAQHLVTNLIFPHASFVHLILILCGTFMVLRQVAPGAGRSPALTWLFAVVPTLALVSAVGNDQVAIGAFSWAPLLAMMIFALLHATREGQAGRVLPLWVIALFVSVQSASSANQVALPVALAALIFARYVLEPHIPTRQAISQRQGFLLSAVALVPALWTTAASPLAPWPDYPAVGHLIPMSGEGLPFIPLVGPIYPLATIDRAALASLYRPSALALCVLSFLALCRWPTASRSHERPLLLVAILCALSLALDTAIPEEWAYQAPIASLSRLLPFGTVVAFTPLALAACAWCLCVAALTRPLSIVGLPVAAAALAIIRLSPPELATPALAPYATHPSETVRKIIHSPSAALVRTMLSEDPHFIENLPRYQSLSHRRMRDASTVGATFTLDPSTFEEPSAQSSRGRFRTNQGGQKGNERLTVTFPAEVLLSGIELSTGSFVSDFPRGVIVSGGRCDGSTAQHILSSRRWQGALRFTREGYPFWGLHSEVKILFSQPQKVECLFIEQTGITTYDWSVERVKVLKEADGSL